MPVFVAILGLLLMGVIEISVIVAVSNALSWEVALLALVIAGAVGAWVVKREGTATWRRVMSGVRAGQMPTSSVLDGCLVIVAGFLLLLPGFVTDVMALALALPPVRKLVRVRATDHFQKRIAAQVSRARTTTTVFGFGDPGAYGGFGPNGFGGPGFGPTGGRGRAVHDDDVIDLDAEEVFLDESIAEIEPPREWPA